MTTIREFIDRVVIAVRLVPETVAVVLILLALTLSLVFSLYITD